jgi:hypothetical protein
MRLIDAVNQQVRLRPAARHLRNELLARMAKRRAKAAPSPPAPEVKAAPLSNQN